MHFTTGELLRTIAEKVFPATLIEKSPSVTHGLQAMERARKSFQGAKFIHLVRHPNTFGGSVINYLKLRAELGPIPPSHWLIRAGWWNGTYTDGANPDPQQAWYALNCEIAQFLRSVPSDQQIRVRGEDLLSEPNKNFPPLLEWLGLSSDTNAMERVKHPEDSPYAFLGPNGAEYGNDRLFLENPVFRPKEAPDYSLGGPVPWLKNEGTLEPKIIRLAQQFGYG